MAPKRTEKPTPVTDPGFAVDDVVVIPAHGVGRISAIESQQVAGMSMELVVVDFQAAKATVKIPKAKAKSLLRRLSSPAQVDKAMALMDEKPKVSRGMWSRRATEYETKINSGVLLTVAEVVRDLFRPESDPDPSYSQRVLYEDAMKRMVPEVAAVRGLTDKQATDLIVGRLSDLEKRGLGRRKGAAEDAEEDEEEAA